jgi:hypothetical protein
MVIELWVFCKSRKRTPVNRTYMFSAGNLSIFQAYRLKIASALFTTEQRGALRLSVAFSKTCFKSSDRLHALHGFGCLSL